jgi:cell division protein FtsX
MQTKLHKTIMRRVYYSYAVDFASQPLLWQGFVLGACVALFGRLTHVAAIVHNLEGTAVSNLPNFVWHAFTNALAGGEVLTALVALFMIGLTISFFYRAFGVVNAGRSVQVA